MIAEMKNILIVDEEALSADFVRYIADMHGAFCQIANNGLDAVELVKNNDFNLILIDLKMPLMSGLDTSRQIRNIQNDRSTPVVPIVAMTSYIDDELEDNCIDAGINLLLPKPISIRAIKSVLKIFL